MDTMIEIVEKNGSFNVVVEFEETNYLGESHTARHVVESFESRTDAEAWIEANEESDRFEPDAPSRCPGYTQTELADDYNTHDYWE